MQSARLVHFERMDTAILEIPSFAAQISFRTVWNAKTCSKDCGCTVFIGETTLCILSMALEPYDESYTAALQT